MRSRRNSSLTRLTGVRKVFTLLAKHGIRANIPPRTTHVTARRKKEKAGFHYDADRDVWVWPEGKTLYKMSQSKPPGHTLYMVNAYACRKCPRHGALCKTKRPSVVDSREDSLLNRVKAYTETGAAKETFRRRKCQVEPAFGEIKTSRGMRQATLRGNWKVQVQALLVFAAYNIKRLVKGTARPRDARQAIDIPNCSLVSLVSRFLRPGRAIAPAF
jgi:hypothetical protein